MSAHREVCIGGGGSASVGLHAGGSACRGVCIGEGDVWADTTGYGQRAGSRHPFGMHSCLFIFQKWKLDRVLNYTGQHLCKSTPLALPPVYLVPLHPDNGSQLEMTVKALVAPGSRKAKNKQPLEAEPLRLIFDPVV